MQKSNREKLQRYHSAEESLSDKQDSASRGLALSEVEGE